MKSSRVLYFDVLNVISCISVVCMHSNGYVHRFVKDDWWWLRVLIEVVCYFAVPVFFMLSGANLLGYRERYSTETFYRKRLLKTFIPFLIWGVSFYGLYWLVGGGHFWLERSSGEFCQWEYPIYELLVLYSIVSIVFVYSIFVTSHKHLSKIDDLFDILAYLVPISFTDDLFNDGFEN